MLKTHVSRLAAGAVISAAFTFGSLGLAATAAGACTTPDCTRGVPPVAASAMECSEPKCLSGTRPAAAPASSAAAGLAGTAGAPATATVVQAGDGCTTSDCGANHNQVLV
jgi:hypothetical protein